MTEPRDPLWIWICGPYAAAGDAGQRARNLAVLNEAAIAVRALGHVPLIGINMALPMMAVLALDPEARDIRQPLSMDLMKRCDACFRTAGASAGADAEVDWFRAKGLPVFEEIEAIPRLRG